MGQKFRRKVGESKAIKDLREFVKGMVFNMGSYVEGASEQLAKQVGSLHRIQAALIELLEERDPGTVELIKAIVEKHGAEYEAAMKKQQEEQAALALKKAAEREALEAAGVANLNGPDNERNAIPDGIPAEYGILMPGPAVRDGSELPADVEPEGSDVGKVPTAN